MDIDLEQDLPPMMFIKASANSHGFVNARDIEDLWRDHFDYFYREYDEFIFVSRCTLLKNIGINEISPLPSILMFLDGHTPF